MWNRRRCERGVRVLGGGTALVILSAFGSAQVRFSDQTVAAGLLPPGSDQPLEVGMTGGGAAGDFDRDGRQDLFLLGVGEHPDMLFLNNGDGTFTDRASEWGVDARHMGAGVAVGDYDGDGWLDLYVTSLGHQTWAPGAHRLYWNTGDGRFVDRAAEAGVQYTSRLLGDGFGSCFGDYDLDGDLDLFVAGWFHNPLTSEGNRLFRNEGDGTFEDVTADAGLHLSPVYGFAPTLVDMDGDRYPELLIAADFGTSRYFVNNRDGTFTDHTRESSVDQVYAGMGSAVGDWNNDGRMDWYVTDIWHPPSRKGNRLLVNRGGHRFSERADSAGVDAGFWGWGAAALDVDQDGLQDLVEVNGWIERQSGQPARLWRNRGELDFEEISSAAGLDYRRNGLGVIVLDYDDDGDQDLVFTGPGRGDLRLFRNDTRGAGSYLRVFLDDSGAAGVAPDGFGARIRVSAAGRRQYRAVCGGCHYLTQSELSAHFGLGAATVVDELVVQWPDGEKTRLANVGVGQTLIVRR